MEGSYSMRGVLKLCLHYKNLFIFIPILINLQYTRFSKDAFVHTLHKIEKIPSGPNQTLLLLLFSMN